MRLSLRCKSKPTVFIEPASCCPIPSAHRCLSPYSASAKRPVLADINPAFSRHCVCLESGPASQAYTGSALSGSCRPRKGSALPSGQLQTRPPDPIVCPALPGGTPSMVSCAPRTTASAAPTTHASRRGCAAVASLVQSGERRSQSTMQPSPVASGPPSDGNLLDGRHLEEKLDIITHEPLARVRHRAP